jgi:decaprenylphospho-beta-D-ribofuranose 2-oxidase
MNGCPLSESLPRDRIESVSGWAENAHVVSYVYRPSTVEGILDAFAVAREHGRYIGLRGAGRSYGDAALAAENVCLDLTRMNRILDWDPNRGVMRVEPGVTIRQIWQYALGDGWWPYVVSGTMHPTVGGAVAMNIHGKNNFKVGTIGDHVREFDLMLPSGEVRTCSRTENADLFYAAIGGFGMLGVFTSLTLEMKRVYSGLLRVEPISTSNWRDMFAVFEERLPPSDYLVGWVDCFASGTAAGRGQIHQANYLVPGEDSAPARTLRVEAQELPDTLFGIVPKSSLWRFMGPFMNNLGVRFVNAAKFHASRLRGHVHLVPHAGFHFLLDYVPDWKRAYGSGGLIQYQSFIPKESAERVFAEQIALCQKRGIVPYLGVFKRHRPDPFLMTHAVDGYSFALDFKVTERNRAAVWSLTAELDRLVLDAGGRFYFAKDSTLHPSRLADYLEEERVQRFLALKHQCDPENLLQTDLYRRIFGPAPVTAESTPTPTPAGR